MLGDLGVHNRVRGTSFTIRCELTSDLTAEEPLGGLPAPNLANAALYLANWYR